MSQSSIIQAPLIQPRQRLVLTAAVALSLLAIAYHAVVVGPRQGVIMLLGIALGLTLYHAAFGFSTAWRTLIVERRGKGLRAQMLMLAVAVCLFFPVLGAGELLGQSVNGFVRPLGTSVVVGAFLFGVGMQIANGCASGNLYHAGGGQIRAIPSILGFMAGALWATHDYDWWMAQPQLPPFSSIDQFGVLLAIVLNLLLFAGIALLTIWLEKRRHGQIEADDAGKGLPLKVRLLSGPWPFIWGAVVLALLNFATLALTGRPWAVSLAYPLWGAKMSELLGLGIDFEFWDYWVMTGRDAALMAPLAFDSASVMNIGIFIGAFLAAALSGHFSIAWRLPPMQWVAAVVGGLLLGYGATIAFGCNIGAFFSGIASGSLHGWLWMLAAFFGGLVGTRLRPLFSLPRG